MNKYRHPKSSLFLMEIMINVLFFAVLVTICLQLFFKAYTLSENTSILHRAVTTCTSIAEVYQSNPDGKDVIMTLYPDALALNKTILIYFDADHNPCTETRSTYRAILEFTDSAPMNITFYNQETGEVLYTLAVSSYSPRTLSELEGGLLYEED